jgi:hypothetical protein
MRVRMSFIDVYAVLCEIHSVKLCMYISMPIKYGVLERRLMTGTCAWLLRSPKIRAMRLTVLESFSGSTLKVGTLRDLFAAYRHLIHDSTTECQKCPGGKKTT